MGLLETLGLRQLGAMPLPSLQDGESATSRSSDAPPAGSERETARAEADAAISPIKALAEGGIRDPKLAARIKAELTPIATAFAKADQQKGDPAAIKAYKALLGPAGKLLARAEQFKAASDLKIDEWDPAAARAKAAIGKVASAPAKAALQAELGKLEAAARPKFAAGDQAALEPLLPALERVDTLSARLATRGAEIDTELTRIEGVVSGLGAAAPAGLAERVAALRTEKTSAWPKGKTLDALEASLDDFDTRLDALTTDADAAKAGNDARIAFETARAAAQADIDAATRLHADKGAVLGAAIAANFAAARKAVDDAVAAGDWPKALAAFPALRTAATKVRTAAVEQPKFETAYAKIRADVLVAGRQATAASPMPGTLVTAFVDADKDVDFEVNKGDWARALAMVPTLATATKALLKTLADGKDFYDALTPNLPIRQAARDMVNREVGQSMTDNAQLNMLGLAFHEADSAMNGAAEAGEWKQAKKLVPEMRRTAMEFVNAQTKRDNERKPYDAARAKLTNRWKADQAAEKPAPAIAAEAAAYLKVRTQVLSHEHTGRFAQALAMLPALQSAIDDLVNADKAHGDAKKTFEAAYAAMPHYAEAKALTANQTPPFVAPIKAFQDADRVVEHARKIENWPAANNALPPLQTAIDALVKAGSDVNAGFAEADAAALQARLDALKARTDKALEAPVPSHIDTHQKAVTGKLADVQARLAEKNYAAAQAALSELESLLNAMESAKQVYANHRAKVAAAKNGPIRAALAVALTPAKLATERAAAVSAGEAAIAKLADAGDIKAADAAIPGWETDARGWAESKRAFAELHGGDPDVDDLEDLMKKPGGEKVLDQLIANMDPNTTPSKVFAAALKARYGFEIKHFKTTQAGVGSLDDEPLGDLEKHDKDRPDPELQKIYALMKKIPSKRIKGKIKQMVDFDTDESRGLYNPNNKKIYLAADRPGKKGFGDQQDFSVSGEVVPVGQKVDPRCEPKDTQPVPEFDWVLLHEVAHAEDDALSFMDNRSSGKDKPTGGWNKESPGKIAAVAATHFGYDEEYICDCLEDKANKPPKKAPKPPDKVDKDEWERRRVAAFDWTRGIRAAASPWSSGSVAAQIAIGNRVYQESYSPDTWFSYDLAARSQGLTAYQFRAPWEWFAELYAAHFSGKLKPEHPAMAFLKQFKPPEA